MKAARSLDKRLRAEAPLLFAGLSISTLALAIGVLASLCALGLGLLELDTFANGLATLGYLALQLGGACLLATLVGFVIRAAVKSG